MTAIPLISGPSSFVFDPLKNVSNRLQGAGLDGMRPGVVLSNRTMDKITKLLT